MTRHEDIRAISKNNELWSANANGVIVRFDDEMDPEALEVTKALVINHDPPEHTRLRKLVSKTFTPRSVHALEEGLAQRAREIVEKAAARGGPSDFVHDVAVELPLQAIADLLGVPQDDRQKLFAWSNAMMNYDDPDFTDDPQLASAQILGYAYEMAEDRKKCPVGDIVTELVHADIDGHALDEIEFGLLLHHADRRGQRDDAQRDHPRDERLPRQPRPVGAVQAGAAGNRRGRDRAVGDAGQLFPAHREGRPRTRRSPGQAGAAGRDVYGSANYDTAVFDDPFTFDITRDPNTHVGFGGHGAHYCVGANLARMEIDLIFGAIADHMPDITKAAEPRYLRHGWINGIKELSVRYR